MPPEGKTWGPRWFPMFNLAVTITLFSLLQLPQHHWLIIYHFLNQCIKSSLLTEHSGYGGNLHQIKLSLIQVSNSASSLFSIVVLYCFALLFEVRDFQVCDICLFFVFVSLPFTFSLHCEKRDDNSHYNMEENKQSWFVLFTRKKVCTALEYSCWLNSEEINMLVLLLYRSFC